jgi:hypothetical protein
MLPRMPAECSICSVGATAAATVNEMFWEGKYLDEVARETGFHRSSLHRHRHGKCAFSFPSYKSARLRAKNKRGVDLQNGRVIVSWPEIDWPEHKIPAHYEVWAGAPVKSEADLRPGDIVLKVVFERFNPSAVPNPGALAYAGMDEALTEDFERSYDAALAENEIRNSATAKTTP